MGIEVEENCCLLPSSHAAVSISSPAIIKLLRNPCSHYSRLARHCHFNQWLPREHLAICSSNDSNVSLAVMLNCLNKHNLNQSSGGLR